VVEAYHPSTGRSSIGTAIASSREKDRWAHEEHDVYTLCHTRAKNRAIADLVGGGEVSAEEVSPDPGAAETQKPERDWHLKPDTPADQIRLEQLFHNLSVVGGIAIDQENQEYAFVPEAEFSADASPIRSFLEKKILGPMRAMHLDSFDYKIDAFDGRLRGVVVGGPVASDRFKELRDAVAWAFAKAAETEPAGGTSS